MRDYFSVPLIGTYSTIQKKVLVFKPLYVKTVEKNEKDNF